MRYDLQRYWFSLYYITAHSTPLPLYSIHNITAHSTPLPLYSIPNITSRNTLLPLFSNPVLIWHQLITKTIDKLNTSYFYRMLQLQPWYFLTLLCFMLKTDAVQILQAKLYVLVRCLTDDTCLHSVFDGWFVSSRGVWRMTRVFNRLPNKMHVNSNSLEFLTVQMNVQIFYNEVLKILNL